MQGENQHTCLRIDFQYLACCFKSVQTGHSDIEDYNIRLKVLHLFNRLAAVGGLAANLPVRLRLQQGNQPFADNLMIVSYQDPKNSHTKPPHKTIDWDLLRQANPTKRLCIMIAKLKSLRGKQPATKASHRSCNSYL